VFRYLVRRVLWAAVLFVAVTIVTFVIFFTRSFTGFDMPIIMGITVFATLAIIVFNLAVDLAYAWVDPRIRLS
jgi:hypothetical protein